MTTSHAAGNTDIYNQTGGLLGYPVDILDLLCEDRPIDDCVCYAILNSTH